MENPLKRLTINEMFSTGGCGKPVQNFSTCGKKHQKLFFPLFPQGKFSLTCGNVENFCLNVVDKRHSQSQNFCKLWKTQQKLTFEKLASNCKDCQLAR